MKDYYYILGLKPTATTEEIKKAYRKLSFKFHPDQNNGDEFFAEHFKEIQEAYETLGNNLKRKNYDDQQNKTKNYSNSSNFSPYIEYFKSNKASFEYDEEVTFAWKTINADKVILKPFGAVQPIGQKTYRIKDFRNINLAFELFAENTNISRQVTSTISLTNKTYIYLYEYFKEKIRSDENIHPNYNKTSAQEKETSNTKENLNLNKNFSWIYVFLLIILIIIALVLSI